MTLSLSNYLAADSAASALRRDVLDGLTQTPKSLPPKWFYDSVGSDLFDQITRLPEYYPTRAEAAILRARAADIAAASGADTLVELGSGTSEKTRILLDAMRDGGSLRRFIPFDVDAGDAHRRGGRHRRGVPRRRDRRGLRRLRGAPRQDPARRPTAGGRSSGRPSATSPQARAPTSSRSLSDNTGSPVTPCCSAPTWSRTSTGWCGPTTTAPGVTARFNKNVLAVVNRELDADFDLDAFDHVARWNADEERIEMWLRASTPQRVRVDDLDLTVDFAAGEEMLTEVSCKFRPEGVAAELAAAGLRRTALVDRSRQVTSGCRSRSNDPGRPTGGTARPPVAGVHLDSAACSRQTFAVIDAAARHARHEAEVGGYVAAEAAAPVLDAGRAAVAALTGFAAGDVVFTTGSNHALDILLGDWRGARTVACLPGSTGPTCSRWRGTGSTSACCPSMRRDASTSRPPPWLWRPSRPRWCTSPRWPATAASSSPSRQSPRCAATRASR